MVREVAVLSYPDPEFEGYDLPMVDVAGARVLIFGINYWPEPTGSDTDTTEMAEYLAAEGAEVKVITGVPHYPNWKVAAPYDRGLSSREHRRGVEVIRLRHSVPRKMTIGRRSAYEASFFAHAALRTINERPDLIVAVTPALGGARAAALVARRTGSPLIVHVQDLMPVRRSGLPFRRPGPGDQRGLPQCGGVLWHR
jgi:colanic acid biosynthesis glycosyl transferase WcaI